MLKKNKMTSYLETNGICVNKLKDIIEDIDIIAMDIKLPSSAKVKDLWEEHAEFLKIAAKKEVFVKTVISKDTAREDIHKAVSLVEQVDKDMPFILQPNTFELNEGVMQNCYDYLNICFSVVKHLHTLTIKGSNSASPRDWIKNLIWKREVTR